MTKRVVITRPFVGLVGMQVCAVKDVSDEEVLRVCNLENPSGTSLGWCNVIRQAGLDRQQQNPVACSDDPGRLHFLVGC